MPETGTGIVFTEENNVVNLTVSDLKKLKKLKYVEYIWNNYKFTLFHCFNNMNNVLLITKQHSNGMKLIFTMDNKTDNEIKLAYPNDPNIRVYLNPTP
jgi:hypothetical protein